MGWAAGLIDKLKAGETVSFRPRGNSMAGKVESGQLVTVEPLSESREELSVGDIVLCKVQGSEYLHLVSGIKRAAGKPTGVQISNNKGYINGWTQPQKVYGKCTKVEP